MSRDQFDRDTATESDAADASWRACGASTSSSQARLTEAEDTLAAIRNGDVDALIVGEDIYTLDSANAATNAMRKDVLAQMQDAVLAFDVDDHVIFMNPAAELQYGCAASEMLGRPRGDLFRERWADAERALHARESLRAHGSYRAESVHVRSDGREMHVECTVSLLQDADAPAARHALGHPQHRRPRAGAGHAGPCHRRADAARAPVRDAGGELARHLLAPGSRPAPPVREPDRRALHRRAGGRRTSGRTAAEMGMTPERAGRLGPRGAPGVRHRQRSARSSSASAAWAARPGCSRRA